MNTLKFNLKSLKAVFFLLTFNFLLVLVPHPAFTDEITPHTSLEDFQLPESLSLCEEPVPLDNPFVREMLDREFIISVWDRAQVFLWLKRASRYFPFIEAKLAEAGVPDDLKYVAVAESALLTHIKSEKGALGVWQFMVHTGRHNGLRKDSMMDERLSLERSTDAALKYLKHLKKLFGTWTLAIAAYNCGETRLKREIKEQKVSQYYRLNLPLETERYVFRIAAIKIILENPARYGYVLSRDSVYNPMEYDMVEIKTDVPLHITDIAKAIGTDFKVIKELNPQLRGYYMPTGSYDIKVPVGLGSETKTVVKQLTYAATIRIKKGSGNFYTVKPGDTLGHIAQRSGVSVYTLRQLNGIRGSLIMAGQKLRLRP